MGLGCVYITTNCSRFKDYFLQLLLQFLRYKMFEQMFSLILCEGFCLIRSTTSLPPFQSFLIVSGVLKLVTDYSDFDKSLH